MKSFVIQKPSPDIGVSLMQSSLRAALNALCLKDYASTDNANTWEWLWERTVEGATHSAVHHYRELYEPQFLLSALNAGTSDHVFLRYVWTIFCSSNTRIVESNSLSASANIRIYAVCVLPRRSRALNLLMAEGHTRNCGMVYMATYITVYFLQYMHNLQMWPLVACWRPMV